jgi:malate dehydrogenase (oxaloacetate-decarboxylating)(NADP+)
VRRQPKRVVFAEGEEEQVIRAAVSFVSGASAPRSWSAAKSACAKRREARASNCPNGVEIINARFPRPQRDYANYLYERLQRKAICIATASAS